MKQMIAVMLCFIMHQMPVVSNALQPAAGTRNYVLTIGQASNGAGMADLEMCNANATQVATVLEERGFEATICHNLCRKEFYEALDAFRRQLQEVNQLVIHYSGFVISVNGCAYLCPRDVDVMKARKEILQQCIPLSALFDLVRAAHAQSAYIIIDGCREEPMLFKNLAPVPVHLQDLPENAAIYYSVANSLETYTTHGALSRFSKWIVAMMDEGPTLKACLDAAKNHTRLDTLHGTVAPFCMDKLYSAADSIAFAQRSPQAG